MAGLPQVSSRVENSFTHLSHYRKTYGDKTPILMYHHIGRSPKDSKFPSLWVPSLLFERQLGEFWSVEWPSISLGEFVAASCSVCKGVILSFDDGYQSVFTRGLPLLTKFRMRAILFVVVNYIGKYNEWDRALGEPPQKLMGKEEIRDWIAAGHEIGSHSLSHPHLPKLSFDEARREIEDSKKILEDIFSFPVRHFSYPYGEWTAQCAEIAEKAGYESACQIGEGVNFPGENPFCLKRLTARRPKRNLRTLLQMLLPYRHTA
ncbi:polysaccharide deacetylase family protein [Methylacidiphilum caldifontis]|uniref:polysaccharide deacetylase family protein n=1 Tax=Methylacidiphilum caldifontis TaxID=2795386 RepID=UPI001A8E1C85|nr:polysaccharide deacetylase family protein [Methylacidiphilum caldifontis]QSR88283.1 polysaccharide deacetylase family protein [Methylacidiphilum caldifontis]